VKLKGVGWLWTYGQLRLCVNILDANVKTYVLARRTKKTNLYE